MASKARAKVVEPEILPPEPEHVSLVKTNKDKVEDFLGAMEPFFRTAAALEARTVTLAARGQALVQPSSLETDEATASFIRDARAHGKAVEAHWSTIVSLFHRVHRGLTAGRAKGTEPVEKAVKRAEQLRASWAAEDRQRRDAEQRRLDALAEQQAALDRQAELDRMEAEALRLEAASDELSAREQAFVKAVASGTEQGEAARLADYKDWFRAAHRLLGVPKVTKAINALRDAAAVRQQAAAVAALPVAPVSAPVVESQTAGGARETYSMEYTDPRLVVEAVIGGKHGMPADLLEPSQAKGTEYARSLRQLVNRWPGCKLKVTPSTV